ncbi:hypothetical protein QUA32_15605 [Microcoleus sp. Pol14D6]|uniref:hypothetical protein n=1 Tax=Microcoleus sp. Pol14D6 TaxID=3055402 RepID=UPI002FD33D56
MDVIAARAGSIEPTRHRSTGANGTAFSLLYCCWNRVLLLLGQGAISTSRPVLNPTPVLLLDAEREQLIQLLASSF